MTPTTNQCTRCTSPAGDTYLCNTCVTALRIELGDIPGLLAELDITMCRLDAISGPTANRRSSETPLPYKHKAGKAVYILTKVVRLWAGTLNHGRVPGDLLASANWLFANTAVLRAHPSAAAAVHALTAATREARRVIDRPSDQRKFLGRCDADVDGRLCPEELYGLPGREYATCPTCGTQWDIKPRQEWMLSVVEDEVETAAVLAALLTSLGTPVAVHDIQRYAKTGQLHWVSMDSSKRRRYRLGDVLDVSLGRKDAKTVGERIAS